MSFDLYFAGTQEKDCESFLLSSNSCRLQSQVNDRKIYHDGVQKNLMENYLLILELILFIQEA